jgi:hypothetical protein
MLLVPRNLTAVSVRKPERPKGKEMPPLDKPYLFVHGLSLDVVMLKGTDAASAKRAAGRIIKAAQKFVSSELHANVQAGHFSTIIQFRGIVLDPTCDPRHLLDVIEDAAAGDE